MALASDEEGGAVDTLQFSFASDIVELVVLTRDDTFLQILREAVGGPKRVWHVLSAEKVSDLLVAGEVGIVVLDVAAMRDGPNVFVTQIKRQFPDLVVVVAGSREAEIALAGLISAGVVYRFIHKPMSPGRARLFAEAAVRKYAEQRLSAEIPQRYPLPRNYLRLGLRLGAVVAAALILTVVLIWMLRSGSRHQPTTATSSNGGTNSHAALLAQAAAALAANRLTSPAGNNALEFYLRASAQNPADPIARAGLADVRDRLLARTETALLEERIDEAAAAIETARRAGVESGRIAFLSAELVKLRDQVKVAQAARLRSAAAKSNSSPQADERVVSLVSLATHRLENGQLIEPDHDSARYYVDAAISIDPNDASVQDAKHSLAVRLLTEAGERLQQDRLVEPANDSAKDYLLTLRGLQPAQPGLAPALQDLGSRLIAKARSALTLHQYPAASSWLDEARSVGFTSPEANSVQQELETKLKALDSAL